MHFPVIDGLIMPTTDAFWKNNVCMLFRARVDHFCFARTYLCSMVVDVPNLYWPITYLLWSITHLSPQTGTVRQISRLIDRLVWVPRSLVTDHHGRCICLTWEADSGLSISIEQAASPSDDPLPSPSPFRFRQFHVWHPWPGCNMALHFTPGTNWKETSLSHLPQHRLGTSTDSLDLIFTSLHLISLSID